MERVVEAVVLISHEEASHGLKVPSGSWTTSESKMFRSTRAEMSAAV